MLGVKIDKLTPSLFMAALPISPLTGARIDIFTYCGGKPKSFVISNSRKMIVLIEAHPLIIPSNQVLSGTFCT